MKVMIVVTHLLGTGHLARALTLGRAFGASGHDTVIVSGGTPAPHLKTDGVALTQLPPLRSDGVDFTRLLDASGAEATPSYLAARETELVSFITSFTPDILITELFPFGRRILKSEFEALLKATRQLPTDPLIFSSIRDILAPPSKPRKIAFADDMIGAFYDGILAHSDPALMPLDLSWPVSDVMAPRLHYTGFVAPPPVGAGSADVGKDEVIVTVGGGDVGTELMQTAVAAAGKAVHLTWRLLVGGADAAARIGKLADQAGPNTVIEPARPDFRQMLYHARASVSLCGYNTALDVLQSGCPAVFVPFDAGGEVEQTIRATALSRQPGIAMMTTADLTADRLLEALATVASAPARPRQTDGMNGAEKTVEIVTRLREADR